MATAIVIYEAAKAIIPSLLHWINEIAERIKLMKITNDQEVKLLKKLDTIKELIEDIKLSEDTSESKALASAFQELKDQIRKCVEYCRPITHLSHTPSLTSAYHDLKNHKFRHPHMTRSDVKDLTIDFVLVRQRASKLAELEDGLEKAISLLHCILSALHRKESKDRDADIKASIEDVATSLGGSGFLSVEDFSDIPPGKVKNLKAELVKTFGHLRLSWEYEGNTAEVKYYDVRISGNSKLTDKQSPHCCVVMSDPQLQCGKRYAFQVRAVTSFPGEWSSEVVTYFKTNAPLKPPKPSVIVTGTTSIEVSSAIPSEEDCSGDQATHWVIEILPKDDDSTADNSKAWTQYCFSLDNSASSQLTRELIDLQAYCCYDVRIKFQNSTGCSEPSDYVCVKTKEPVPSIPTNFRISSRRTAHMIKLRWNKPDTNNRFVDHYEIEVCKKKGKWKIAGVPTPPKISFRVEKLSQDTKYFFRIRAVNKSDEPSHYTEIIEAETRFNKAAKAVLTPLVFAGGAIASPFLLGASAGAVTGLAIAEDEDELDDVSNGRMAAAVASGIGVGVGATALATITSPIMGPLTGFSMAFAFANPELLDICSEQSDEEEEKPSLKKKIFKYNYTS